MSEYQYYEFRAVDRPLGQAEQRELRAISTRARITAASFVNHYEWGDFKGDPDRLMERYFDLFLYLANWGSRRLSVRLPKRSFDLASIERFLIDSECATLRIAGENLIIDVARDEIENEEDDDGEGWLDAMASLRDDILGGDLRVFYLVWLTTVESGEAPDDAIEPLAGIAPLTPTLEAFAQFFCIDGDLLAAAADATPAPFIAEPPRSAVMKTIDGLSQREKADYLLRLYDGDPHLRTDLRRRCRGCMTSLEDRQTRRSVAELRANACKLADDRRRIEAERIQVEQRRREQQEARAKKRRLDELAQRGEAAWSDVESLITFRNIPAYEKTVALLGDLRDLSLRQGTDDDFHHRLVQLRTRHKAKPRLVERLTAAGLD